MTDALTASDLTWLQDEARVQCILRDLERQVYHCAPFDDEPGPFVALCGRDVTHEHFFRAFSTFSSLPWVKKCESCLDQIELCASAIALGACLGLRFALSNDVSRRRPRPRRPAARASAPTHGSYASGRP
jgi:hypothetical protein